MRLRTPRRMSVSTWALHPLIGFVAPGRAPSAGCGPEARLMDSRPGTLDLLDVPAQLAAHGFYTMELCHFHLPSTDRGYLLRLRERASSVGVEMWSLLIDDGDLTHPEHGGKDNDWIAGWIGVAAVLGTNVRVIAGKQPAVPEAIMQSAAHLASLADDASAVGARLMTENWFSTLSTPGAVDALFESLGDRVGLCLDFGNWSGETKYGDLAAIAPYAESCHAKCEFIDGEPNTNDYLRCLNLMKGAGYSGPFTLVHSEPSAVWSSLDTQRDLVTPYL